ncbi:MAG TPA: NTP transferase domain-containing protein [Gaiellaceae bacterium]
MPTIVIPFRGREGKRRLPGELRRPLAYAMLADVAAAALELGRTLVVTPEALELPVETVADPGRGQGAAVEAALSEAVDSPILVLNADLPAVTPRDLLVLLGSIPPAGLAVAPAADGTTNALALSAPALFSPLYGPGSAERFLALGPSRRVELPNLAADVDTLADLEGLEASLGRQTAAALEALRTAAR